MRVLIAGSRGQLGTDLVHSFSDCQVTPYTSEDMEITDEAQVQQRIAFTSPDLVINAAAFTRVDECERENGKAFNINALGPRNLALACKKWDVPLVHISTNYVFDGEKESPYDETDCPRPLNTYGITKLAGEHYVQAIWPKHYIIRVSGLFGLTPSRMKGTNFVETMLRLGKKGTPLRIVSDEYLAPTYTVDAAKAIREIIKAERFGLYHLSNSGQCSWYEFAKEIFCQSGLSVALESVSAKEYGAPAKRPKNSVIVSNYLKTHDIPHLPPWQEALAHYLKHREEKSE